MAGKLPTATPHLHPGVVLAGQWKIGNKLSETRYSLVYSAHHARTNASAAVKVLAPPGGVLTEELEARFEREAMATAQFASPTLLRVWDFGRTPAGFPYLVMERLDGVTLRKTLDTRWENGEPGLPPSATIVIADAVLRALMEAHSDGIIHRGVKPDNIFLASMSGGEIVPKLIDFGIAKDLSEPLTSAGDRLGTPTHMSPEQTRGAAIDGRADIYGLGVVMYECLTGSLPFEATTPLAMAVAHASEKPIAITKRAKQHVSRELAAVVHKALAKDPAERWADATAMRDALHAVASTVDARGLLRGPMDLIAPMIQRRRDELAAEEAAQRKDLTRTSPLSTVRPMPGNGQRPRPTPAKNRRPPSGRHTLKRKPRPSQAAAQAPKDQHATEMMDVVPDTKPPPIPPARPPIPPPPRRPNKNNGLTRVSRFAQKPGKLVRKQEVSRPTDSTTVRERKPNPPRRPKRNK